MQFRPDLGWCALHPTRPQAPLRARIKVDTSASSAASTTALRHGRKSASGKVFHGAAAVNNRG
jgi:hypothetical protein